MLRMKECNCGLTHNENVCPDCKQLHVDKRIKRTEIYCQNPNVYGIECNKCNGVNIDWSEYEKHIWCYDCEEDVPGTDGIFSGPIMIGVAEIIGICFDRINLESGERIKFNGVDYERN